MYAALVIAASLIAFPYLRELPGAALVRGIAALGLAFAVTRFDASWDRWTVAFIVWFGVFGVLPVVAPLWQRYVPTSDELRILIEPVSFGVALISQVLLVVAGLSLAAARRVSART